LTDVIDAWIEIKKDWEDRAESAKKSAQQLVAEQDDAESFREDLLAP